MSRLLKCIVPLIRPRIDCVLLALSVFGLSIVDASPIRNVRYAVIVNTVDDEIGKQARHAIAHLAEEMITEDGVVRGRFGTVSWAYVSEHVDQVIRVPDLNGNFESEADFANAKECLDQLSKLVDMYPQVREVLLPLGKELKSVVDSGEKGLVRRDGEWQEKGMVASAEDSPLVKSAQPDWEPKSLDDVASCSLFVKVIDAIDKEGEQSSGGGSAFLCNVDGVTYIYSNVHNFDGTRQFVIYDQNGRQYKDFDSVEVAAEGQGFYKDLGWGGDVIRLRLREYIPRALTLSEMKPGASDVGRAIAVTGNTKDRDEITKLTGRITEIANSGIIVHNAKTQAGNSGSPIVDAETYRVLGVLTWGTYDDEDPLSALWSRRSDDERSENGSGPILVNMEFKPSTLEGLYRHREVFNALKQDTRLLGMLDTLYPRKEGVFADFDQIVMGDYTIGDLLRESPEHPIVEKLLELNEALILKAQSNIGISNQDMFKRYIDSYEWCISYAGKFRKQVAGKEMPTYYMKCNFENSRIVEIGQAYEQVLQKSLMFYEDQSSTKAETWAVSERIRLPAFRSGFNALMEVSE